jgi:hypothetical protein
MTRRVIVSPQAEAQLREIDSWWRTYRQAAPAPFK